MHQLLVPTSQALTPITDTESDSSSGGSQTHLTAGVAAGVALLVILAIAAVLLVVLRRRRNAKGSARVRQLHLDRARQVQYALPPAQIAMQSNPLWLESNLSRAPGDYSVPGSFPTYETAQPYALGPASHGSAEYAQPGHHAFFLPVTGGPASSNTESTVTGPYPGYQSSQNCASFYAIASSMGPAPSRYGTGVDGYQIPESQPYALPTSHRSAEDAQPGHYAFILPANQATGGPASSSTESKVRVPYPGYQSSQNCASFYDMASSMDPAPSRYGTGVDGYQIPESQPYALGPASHRSAEDAQPGHYAFVLPATGGPGSSSTESKVRVSYPGYQSSQNCASFYDMASSMDPAPSRSGTGVDGYQIPEAREEQSLGYEQPIGTFVTACDDEYQAGYEVPLFPGQSDGVYALASGDVGCEQPHRSLVYYSSVAEPGGASAPLQSEG
jgi:hypothetical protein